MHCTGHPTPQGEEEGEGEREEGEGRERDPQQWSWPLYTAIAVLIYLLTSVKPTLEISFPYFLQHMLCVGEVSVLLGLPAHYLLLMFVRYTTWKSTPTGIVCMCIYTAEPSSTVWR